MNDPAPLEIPQPLAGWMARAVLSEASDLHLVVGHPPALRIHGELAAIAEPVLTAPTLEFLIESICTAETLARLRAEKDLDLSLEMPIEGQRWRFRVNLFHSSRQLGVCLRVVPSRIPEFEWAGFPHELAQKLAFLRDGLVIITGATGSGKTTTLAMILQLLNQTGGYRIITVEEPVEYVFPKAANSVVTQREVGTDVLTFADGLKYGLRQDPDVFLVGEIRDQETAQMAMSAAETGHLVFTSLHTRDVKGAISRYADLFSQDVQKEIRGQLALSLRAIVSQRLLPALEKGAKRHLALEVLWNTYPIASAIRQGKLDSIDNYLLTGRNEGMLSIDESLRQLLRAGKISREVAEQNIRDPSMLTR